MLVGAITIRFRFARRLSVCTSQVLVGLVQSIRLVSLRSPLLRGCGSGSPQAVSLWSNFEVLGPAWLGIGSLAVFAEGGDMQLPRPLLSFGLCLR